MLRRSRRRIGERPADEHRKHIAASSRSSGAERGNRANTTVSPSQVTAL
jgi:hypothetical protein